MDTGQYKLFTESDSAYKTRIGLGQRKPILNSRILVLKIAQRTCDFTRPVQIVIRGVTPHVFLATLIETRRIEALHRETLFNIIS